MTEPLIIRSADDGARLEIFMLAEGESANRVDYFGVSLSSAGLRAETRIYKFDYPYGANTLAEFFSDVSANWRGWEGEKVWVSIEYDFKLTCISDSLGHVFMTVLLDSDAGGSHNWQVKYDLTLEAGQLDAIARDVKRFLAVK
jgi:hypothetical protein